MDMVTQTNLFLKHDPSCGLELINLFMQNGDPIKKKTLLIFPLTISRFFAFSKRGSSSKVRLDSIGLK